MFSKADIKKVYFVGAALPPDCPAYHHGDKMLTFVGTG
jgi:hypothetical protein